MKRSEMDWGYLFSFFSVAVMVALVPAACSEEAKPTDGEASQDEGGRGGGGSIAGADGEDAGSGGIGGNGEVLEMAGAGTGGANEAGSGGAGTAGMGASCEEPTSACDETCVDLSSSFEHCGACDRGCKGSQACVEGECHARAWGTPFINAGFDFFNPIVQLAEDGTAFLVAQSFHERATLKAALLHHDTSMNPGFALETLPLQHDESISEFRFATNRTGKGVVAFVTSAAPKKLYAAYFDGKKLGAPVLLDDSGLGVGYSPYIDVGLSLTMADDGAANVVYPRFQSGTAGAEDLYWVRSPGFGEPWDAPTPLEVAPDSVTEHVVASNGKARLLASWVQSNVVVASTLDNGSWSQPTPISGDGQVASQPRVAVDSAGRAIVVFVQSKAQENGVYRASFDGESWSSPELLAGSEREEKYPAVALRADGSGIFSYEVRGSVAENDRVFVIPFEPASALPQAQELTSTTIVGQAPRAFVGPGRSGGVFWSNMDNVHRTKVAFTDSGDFTEWAIPSGLYHSVIPSIDYNDSGDGIMVWHDSSTSLGYRRYQALR